jgi:hypothetical protein
MIVKVIKFQKNISKKSFMEYEHFLVNMEKHVRSEFLPYSKIIICRFDDEIDFLAFLTSMGLATIKENVINK